MPVLGRSLNGEVRRRLAGTVQLRTHAAGRGLQRAVGQCRPVAAHLGIENVAARRVDAVVDGVGLAGVQPRVSGPKRAWPARSSVRCTPRPPSLGSGYTRSA